MHSTVREYDLLYDVKALLSSLSHTQKGPRDGSEAVLAGGPLRAGATATCIHDLEWPP